MTTKGQTQVQEIKLHGLLDCYLRFRSSNARSGDLENHLDEDSLTAFIEGKVGQRESPPMIRHLIDCSYCLHVTGELAKLNAVFANEGIAVPLAATRPSKVGDVLAGLISRIFGTSDNAVFAHQESDEDDENKKDKIDDNDGVIS